jgi:uncharacterized protein (DUF1499 family)
MTRQVFLVLALLVSACAASARPKLGVENAKLAACPSSPNCVSSQAADADHRIEPLPIRTTPEEGMARLAEIISAMPRTRIVAQNPDYLRAEFTSRIFSWVDDVEAYLDAEAKLIHLRSSSRTGYSDLGANRSRIEAIRERYAAVP